MNLNIIDYIRDFVSYFPELQHKLPWEITANIGSILENKIAAIKSEYRVQGNIAIHPLAQVEEHCMLKGPLIVSEGCFIAAHAYLRGGVFLGKNVVIGPASEIKSSIVLQNTALAHFNFIGDSLVGSHVNMEAGSIIANHFNERSDKTIFISYKGKPVAIDSKKFGALIGDGTKIGANAVLSPGTILLPDRIVKRLELVEQCPSS